MSPCTALRNHAPISLKALTIQGCPRNEHVNGFVWSCQVGVKHFDVIRHYGIDVVDNHAQPSEFVFVQVRYKGNCNRSRDKYYEF